MAIRKLLVANRGEIAVRIFRTCRELGIATVAVAAPDDARRAARALGRRDGRDRVATSTRRSTSARRSETGADAIHPGLRLPRRERRLRRGGRGGGARLRRADAGGAARRRRQARGEAGSRAAAGVPVARRGRPEELGFPLLVKAAAGGGGRGMRVVRRPAELDDALEAARREAEAAFGDDTRLLRALPRAAAPRRDPAARRRRTATRRARRARVLGAAPPPEGARGVALARARPGAARADERRGGRVRRARSATASAGTAEFVLDGRDFFFLELNGRIQVEHPVTELVTGRRPRRRAAPRSPTASRCRPVPELRGHAVEVRLYAEDPRTFLPQAGPDRAAAAAGRACASTPASRRATRSAPPTTR